MTKISTMSTKTTTAATKKTATKKVATKKVVEAAPQVAATVATENVPQEATQTVTKSKKSSNGPKKQRTRRTVTRESLEADFVALQKRIEEEIEKLRGSNEKVKGVKFLRSVNKSIKLLKSDSSRVMKIRPKTNRPRSTTSGFMKPVRISPQMSTFTGWAPNDLYSRVDVTKFICKYIKDNKLQNTGDRRQIVCDEKLRGLLNYDASTAKEPLTYFRLQQYIQPHFVKEAPAVATTVEEETVDVEEADE